LFSDADYRQQSCFEETPLKQVLHNFLLNSTQNRNKYVTEFLRAKKENYGNCKRESL